ncbi:MAG: HAMP domain-containing histidine kinase [Chromatiales bacterium]|nr:HAMP domain-containing histidine kinase [Chromatiales bacterium]
MHSNTRSSGAADQRDELARRHQRLAALGEMAATLAHQVRTPLSAALLYALNARQQGLPAAQRDLLLDRTVACLHDLERLVAGMLDFTRDARLGQQKLSVAALLESVEYSAGALLKPGQQLTIKQPRDALTLDGRREALAGALLNLLSNALEASGPGARVTLTACRGPVNLELRVSDNGPGVPELIRERIFDAFFTARRDGTGIGLAAARTVAQAHGGQLTLEESGPSGSTFLLSLPLASPGRTALAAPPAVPESTIRSCVNP